MYQRRANSAEVSVSATSICVERPNLPDVDVFDNWPYVLGSIAMMSSLALIYFSLVNSLSLSQRRLPPLPGYAFAMSCSMRPSSTMFRHLPHICHSLLCSALKVDDDRLLFFSTRPASLYPRVLMSSKLEYRT